MKFRTALVAAFLATVAAPALAADAVDVLAGTNRQMGLLPVHIDAKQGRILLSLPQPGADGLLGRYLYIPALKTGLGAAPVLSAGM